MPKSPEVRLAALEKALGTPLGRRRAHSLLQVVWMSRGLDAGPPAELLKPGERSISELILDARRAR